MARIQLSSVISDIRGKIAGQVFKGSSHGVVLQTKTTRVISEGNSFGTSIGLFLPSGNGNQLPLLYSSLSLQDKTAWEQMPIYADMKSGKSHFNRRQASGYTAFMRCNTARFLCGLSLLEKPVFSAPVWKFPSISEVKEAAGVLTVSTNVGIAGIANYMVIEATAPVHPNKKNKKAAAKKNIMGVIAPGSDTLNITARYKDVFVLLPGVGASILCNIYEIDGNTGLSNSSDRNVNISAFIVI